jgi:hypothetical protein
MVVVLKFPRGVIAFVRVALVLVVILATGAAAGIAQTVAPSSYSAMADRSTYTKPALPAIGPAGSHFTDPTFGSAMARVTDASTRPGAVGQSYTTPSAAHQTAWNADSTYFYVRSVDGYFIPYAFNASTMTASRVQAASSGAGGLLVASQAEPQFSFVSPNVLYVTGQDPTYDWPIVRRFDMSTGSYTDLVNLGQVAPIAHSTYTGGLLRRRGTGSALSRRRLCRSPAAVGGPLGHDHIDTDREWRQPDRHDHSAELPSASRVARQERTIRDPRVDIGRSRPR